VNRSFKVKNEGTENSTTEYRGLEYISSDPQISIIKEDIRIKCHRYNIQIRGEKFNGIAVFGTRTR
jgi:hypothetical protein